MQQIVEDLKEITCTTGETITRGKMFERTDRDTIPHIVIEIVKEEMKKKKKGGTMIICFCIQGCSE